MEEPFPWKEKTTGERRVQKLRDGLYTDEETASSEDGLALVEKVQFDGLMEFVSVPWENGCDSNHHEYRRLTVNLALWFAHILAGNDHRLDWDWGLCEESVGERAQQNEPIRGHKRPRSPSPVPTMRKRNRQEKTGEQAQNQEIPDPIALPNMSLGQYAESSDDDDDSTVDGDLESQPLKKRGIR
ncbi:hypothetical protein E0Z10_g4064 [Xylaria hypoxylon]|uniref:Uncharacterized protein n=1 Tax=Xylaria hypoxylon TaxID=37992 RepID=A0A4Z0Z5F2_9PEZI|nr:hypothetical protein E0Z10_g4064 [Xylaria hypoxylon]